MTAETISNFLEFKKRIEKHVDEQDEIITKHGVDLYDELKLINEEMSKRFTEQKSNNEVVEERFIYVVKRMFQNKYDMETKLNQISKDNIET